MRRASTIARSQVTRSGLSRVAATRWRMAGLVAAWDFSKDISTTRVTDVGPHGLHGSAVQMPTRGVTGHNHTGRETNFRLAPDEYGAIHFHDDDLEDALWEVDFELTVPDDLRSGVYAAWVRSGDDEDYITFFVRPADGAKTAPIGVLMSTVSYVTYANFRDVDGGFWNPERVPNADPSLNPASHEFLRANQMPGLYDFHTDGTGAALCSWRRPILNMRATYRYRVWSAPSRFPADLYMIDWLEARGLAYDVITDHDLHAQGADLLKRHRVIISGSHPEYWTSPMIQGLETFLDDGGRMMYLGGNGFFGVTAVDPNRPHVVEVRRWGTSWPFEHAPAERVIATTGELGGTWRNRGRPPQALVGIGCGSAGFDKGSPYFRLPDSHDPRAAFIFDGIGDDERIGDIPFAGGQSRRRGLRNGPPGLRSGHAAAHVAAGLVAGAFGQIRRVGRRGAVVHARHRRREGLGSTDARRVPSVYSRRHDLLRDAQWRRRVLGGIHCLALVPIPQRL